MENVEKNTLKELIEQPVVNKKGFMGHLPFLSKIQESILNAGFTITSQTQVSHLGGEIGVYRFDTSKQIEHEGVLYNMSIEALNNYKNPLKSYIMIGLSKEDGVVFEPFGFDNNLILFNTSSAKDRLFETSLVKDAILEYATVLNDKFETCEELTSTEKVMKFGFTLFMSDYCMKATLQHLKQCLNTYNIKLRLVEEATAILKEKHSYKENVTIYQVVKEATKALLETDSTIIRKTLVTSVDPVIHSYTYSAPEHITTVYGSSSNIGTYEITNPF